MNHTDENAPLNKARSCQIARHEVNSIAEADFQVDPTSGSYIAPFLRFLDEAHVGMVRVNLETAGVEYLRRVSRHRHEKCLEGHPRV
ncbi:hypothetical protein NZD89_12760 [Alicyclobacillus fastidiosus]|uniref:Uncharacterized protein n=1 Tax=Alicyclobacillus fastidiosus TaxID=392011 RepID=A0ABY6ZP00_9BACL|nr:hypothetical protein [Alicyclobacillus fastidiosus]WAH44167.1 hypothetical protein NZD89_12760 [Alicyclobacillus fastidiosus]GMA60478.1 hypothetical protein GCM10025859_09180 [Alicyclobacillus fastidiosus]